MRSNPIPRRVYGLCIVKTKVNTYFVILLTKHNGASVRPLQYSGLSIYSWVSRNWTSIGIRNPRQVCVTKQYTSGYNTIYTLFIICFRCIMLHCITTTHLKRKGKHFIISKRVYLNEKVRDIFLFITLFSNKIVRTNAFGKLILQSK